MSGREATVEEVTELPEFSPEAIRFSLNYTKEDALSLASVGAAVTKEPSIRSAITNR